MNTYLSEIQSKSTKIVEETSRCLPIEAKKPFSRPYRGSTKNFEDRRRINRKMLVQLRFFLAKKLHQLATKTQTKKALEGFKIVPLILQFFYQNQKSINERQARNYAYELSLRDTNIQIFRNKSNREGWKVRMLFNQKWVNRIEKDRLARINREKLDRAIIKRKKEEEKLQKMYKPPTEEEIQERHEIWKSVFERPIPVCESEVDKQRREEAPQKRFQKNRQRKLDMLKLETWDEVIKLREEFIEVNKLSLNDQMLLPFMDCDTSPHNKLGQQFRQFVMERKNIAI
jgi:hypothetical protein